ncbi:MAG: hypothetical protein ABFS21_03475 [Actinomycetota bacterium]
MTRRSVGRLLILFGVAVWGVYGVMALAGAEPQVSHFLPFHLSGVIPGSVLTRWRTA